MNKRLFVARLPWSVNDATLRDLFAPYGEIIFARVNLDRETGRSKGFGFVEFKDANDARNAMESLNGSTVEGRQIVVNIAKPQENRQAQR